MSRIGAAKKRERENPRAEWVFVAPPMVEEPEPVWDVWTEEQAKVACGIALFFLRLNPRKDWYSYCVEQSCQCPMGSYRYTFWWSLRMFGPDKKEPWSEWEGYFHWKAEEFGSGRCSGEQANHPW